jgi:hypothetical protein
MVSYKLANPKVVGKFNDTVTAKSKVDAANKLWLKLTKHVTHNVPNFMFTLKNTQNGGFCHFQVQENVKGKMADYNIKEISLKLTAKQKKNLNNENQIFERINNQRKKHTGGYKPKHKRKNDDSSSSSEDEDIYNKYKLIKYINEPVSVIDYWWYTPTIYNPKIKVGSTTNYDVFYVPTFTAPLYPYVQIDLSSAFFA